MKQVLLYLPVVHAGHEAFFARHGDAAEVLVLGEGFRGLFKSLAKDIRALPPERAAQFLQVMLPDTPVRVIEPADHAADQEWQLVPGGTGTDELANAASGLLLGVAGASTAPGALTLQWPDNGTPDHQWWITPAS